jgi:hypothetical protein
MKIVSFFLVAAFAGAMLGSCTQHKMEVSEGGWSGKDIVQDEKAAIAVAHAIWFALDSQRIERAEKCDLGWPCTWPEKMKATLDGDVWTVSEKFDVPILGGGINIMLSRKDARLVDIYYEQ